MVWASWRGCVVKMLFGDKGGGEGAKEECRLGYSSIGLWPLRELERPAQGGGELTLAFPGSLGPVSRLTQCPGASHSAGMRCPESRSVSPASGSPQSVADKRPHRFPEHCGVTTLASLIMDYEWQCTQEHLTWPRRVGRIRDRFLGGILEEELAAGYDSRL